MSFQTVIDPIQKNQYQISVVKLRFNKEMFQMQNKLKELHQPQSNQSQVKAKKSPAVKALYNKTLD